MTFTQTGLWLGVSLVVCCLSVNGGNAQQAAIGATDVDGLYQPADEIAPPVGKPRHPKRAAPQVEKQATSSKLTDWAEQAGRQQAEDDRLKRRLKICQNC